jgi:tRNA(Arg) A34 adenosine deaminase TadA
MMTVTFLSVRAIDTIMCLCSRRKFLLATCGGLAVLLPSSAVALELDDQVKFFVAEAGRMKREALFNGDQPFGAVVVKGRTIVGYGPSRVVVDRNPDAHAERVALWDAQRRLGTRNLSGAIIYSTSRPCEACQKALALANLDRMFFGPDAADAGKPSNPAF